ncbi:ribonuclease HII [Chloroflexota bacterium]
MIPSFIEERELEKQGYRYIAGVDEVGRGALAGPVVAAAIILPSRVLAPWFPLIRDSKELSSGRRQILYHYVHEVAIATGIGFIEPRVIDDQGIVKATRLAMKLAIGQLSPVPEALLIDYMCLPELRLPQKGVVNGDSLCFSIACASIIAKVVRDSMMIELDRIYPDYGLARHKGYGTREHLACLRQLGQSPVHRESFKPVRDVIYQRR